MKYDYDAFFSYKRDEESDKWHEIVKNKLAFWLRQELGKQDVRIFFDSKEIRTGDQWRMTIADALKRSTCIICVWSPLYFQSKWCVSEWKTFVERGQISKKDLIVPASFFDGENFPKTAKDVQFSDFSDFASTMPSFWATNRADEFETQLLRPFAQNLAKKIKNAPPYDEGFTVVEVADELVGGEETIERIADV